MEFLWHDLRHSARSLAARPLFALLAIAIVSVGIGSNVAIGRLAQSLFLQSLPVKDPHRLLAVYESRDGKGYLPMSHANYVDYRNRTTVFEELASHYSAAPINVVAGERAEVLLGSIVSDNYFSMLGIHPAEGRFFAPEEHLTPGQSPVAVISYALWQSWFGGDVDVIGRTVRLNGIPFDVVGVAPRSFHGVLVGYANDVWIRSAMSSVGYRYCDTFSRGCTYLNLLGRLKPGRTMREARVELSVIAKQLEAGHPETNLGKGVSLAVANGIRPGNDQAAELIRLLAAVVAAVLIVACANLAGLFLARNINRRGEIAVRLSLGASRGRIVRQLLTETLLVALLGGAGGLIVASWTRDSLIPFFYFDKAWLLKGTDTSVVAIAVTLSAAVGVVFGLGPALTATRLNVSSALKGTTSSSGKGVGGLRGTVVVVQVALSLALLVGTSVLLQSFRNVIGGAPFSTEDVLTLRLRPGLVGYDADRARTLHRAVLDRLASVPGVRSVGFAVGLPHWIMGPAAEISFPATEPSGGKNRIVVPGDAVTPDYFATIGLPLLRGRDFEDNDRRGTPPVMIVNQTLAEKLWPSENPVGQSVLVGPSSYEVIGVVADAFQNSLANEPMPYFYRSYWQSKYVQSRLCVRTERDPAKLADLIRHEIAQVDPDVPVSEIGTLETKLGDSVQSLQFAATVSSFSGFITLLLTAAGLYGALALLVGQRIHEIGIRMALGARARHVVRLVVGRSLAWTVVGLILGIPIAFLFSRLMSRFLFRIDVDDPWLYGGSALVLVVVVLGAAFLPARRAVRIEPSSALRYE